MWGGWSAGACSHTAASPSAGPPGFWAFQTPFSLGEAVLFFTVDQITDHRGRGGTVRGALLRQVLSSQPSTSMPQQGGNRSRGVPLATLCKGDMQGPRGKAGVQKAKSRGGRRTQHPWQPPGSGGAHLRPHHIQESSVLCSLKQGCVHQGEEAKYQAFPGACVLGGRLSPCWAGHCAAPLR